MASNAPKSFLLTAELSDYLVADGTPPDAVQRALIDETAELGGVSMMQIAPEQGTFLTLLTRLLDPAAAIEVGTFTGYSALCIALGLRAGAQLVCCDVSEEWTSVGRKHWEAAGVADRIDLRIAPALDTIAALKADEKFGLAFIDADKPNYGNYFDALLPHMAPNSVILVDNVLWAGSVIDPTVTDENTLAIKAFNDKIAADDRVETVMIPLADGLTLARVK